MFLCSPDNCVCVCVDGVVYMGLCVQFCRLCVCACVCVCMCADCVSIMSYFSCVCMCHSSCSRCTRAVSMSCCVCRYVCMCVYVYVCVCMYVCMSHVRMKMRVHTLCPQNATCCIQVFVRPACVYSYVRTCGEKRVRECGRKK